MADEFPDPDEEFELMHAEEMEMLNEMEDFDLDDVDSGHDRPRAKRSLEFKSPSNGISKMFKSSSESDPLQNNSFVSCDETIEPPTATLRSTPTLDTHSQEPVNTETLIHALDEVREVSNKRRVEDLFGDIDDIDFDDIHTSKRTKQDELTEDERQILTIETIVLERKRLQEAKILPHLSNYNSRTVKSAKAVFSRNVPRWNFMPLTDKTGERIYARLKSEEEHEKEISQMSTQNLPQGLLSVPFEQLQKLAHEQLQKKWERIDKKLAEERLRTEVQIISDPAEELWVEKYKPKSYLELLSDESTNRALLQWLKLWDKVVFNIERKVKIKHKEDAKGKGGRFQKKTGPVVSEELDEHGRPFHKIALLCGPPGLGKTTLAHMIAHQAGYNVVEVNASDDRSPEIFRTQLEAATQMRAVMGAERRPNCLVLDEIDGAPAASIDVLLKFALGKATGRKKGMKPKKAPGEGEKSGILKRPIICICNDVYVPALRPLRQIAFVAHFPPTATTRLAQRLCEISRLQSLKADMGVMMALSEKTNNDIRACLGMLQCLKIEPGKAVKLSQVNAAALGQKDMQKGLFTVWQEIFQIPRHKRKTFVDTVNRDANLQSQPDSSENKLITSTLSERVSSVLRTVQGCGDYERLAQGVFENYLNIKIKDSSMVSVANGLSWFCHFDLVCTKIHTTQNYILYPYLAYPFAVWHLLFATLSWPKLTYPSTSYEMTMKLQKSLQLVDEVLKCMMPGVRAHTYREQLILDILPLLLDIIVPNLRPVSLTLYSSKEKEELAHVISVMIDYNLTYSQERTLDGNFVFSLDPNVEEVCRFDGGKGCRALAYSGRQLVSREIELEKLRRAETSLFRETLAVEEKDQQAANRKRNNSSKTVTTPKGAEKKVMPNHLQKLTPKAVKKPEDLQTKDFFGRVVENSLVPNRLKARTDEIVKSDIWYHFKEGFNNAVRRNVTMADLL